MNYRHGELGIFRVDRLPTKARKSKDNILAEGEITGHKHIAIGDVAVYDVLDEATGVLTKYLKVKEKGANLTHPEHGTYSEVLLEGIYKVKPAREYQPEGWRYVAD